MPGKSGSLKCSTLILESHSAGSCGLHGHALYAQPFGFTIIFLLFIERSIFGHPICNLGERQCQDVLVAIGLIPDDVQIQNSLSQLRFKVPCTGKVAPTLHRSINVRNSCVLF